MAFNQSTIGSWLLCYESAGQSSVNLAHRTAYCRVLGGQILPSRFMTEKKLVLACWRVSLSVQGLHRMTCEDAMEKAVFFYIVYRLLHDEAEIVTVHHGAMPLDVSKMGERE